MEQQIDVRVYLEDTDAGGIVFYINYLKYMERARTELLRRLGFDFAGLQETGFKFVVYKAQVEYHLPASMDDELVVSASPVKVARTHVVFRQGVYRQGVQLCSGLIQVACVGSGTMKPVAMPPALREAFATLTPAPDVIPR